MRVHETITGYESETFSIQHMPAEERGWVGEDSGQFERKYLRLNLLDNNYLLEIIQVWYIIDHPDIARYTEIVGCAFIQIEEKPVLVIDLRDEWLNTGEVPVVIAEARFEGNITLFGFIVDSMEDIYRRVV